MEQSSSSTWSGPECVQRNRRGFNRRWERKRNGAAGELHSDRSQLQSASRRSRLVLVVVVMIGTGVVVAGIVKASVADQRQSLILATMAALDYLHLWSFHSC
ncbi:hypothetical protein Bca4012_064848 [Brassica carinata]